MDNSENQMNHPVFLVKGYTINEKRLLELQKTIKLVNRTIQLIRLKKTDFIFMVQKANLEWFLLP